MKKYSFAKFSGAGNDFILFDRRENDGLEITPKLVSKLCERRKGIGADGVLAIEDSTDVDFNMQYFNADGSTGALCGNGARCAIKYAHLSGRLTDGNAVFTCNSKEYSGQVLEGDIVKFILYPPNKIKTGFRTKAYDQLIEAGYVDIDAPHVVININEILEHTSDPFSGFKDLNKIPVLRIGKEIRFSDDFAPEGTNVNFIKVENNSIFIRTYERGVEDETFACGTGSVSSAIIAYKNFNIKPPFEIIARSGDKLTVDFDTNGEEIKNLSLTGPAVITFVGEFYSI